MFLFEVRIKGDGRQIQIAVPIKVARDHRVGAMHRVKEGLAEMIPAVVQVNAEAMIILQGQGKITVVTIRGDEIWMTITIHVGQFKTGETPRRRLLQHGLHLELAAALVQKQIDAFARLGHHHENVRPTVAVEVAHFGMDRARPIEEHMFLVTSRVLVLEPRELPQPIPKRAHQ